jgi:hypothetical protein
MLSRCVERVVCAELRDPRETVDDELALVPPVCWANLSDEVVRFAVEAVLCREGVFKLGILP